MLTQRRAFTFAAIIIAITPLHAAGPAPMAELVVDPSRLIEGSINGVPERFMLKPMASKIPLLTPEGARKASLKPGWIKFSGKIGDAKIRVFNGVVKYTAPGTAVKKRIAWFDRPIVPGYDGLLGPGAVTASVVTFRLRATQAGDRVFSLPLYDRGFFGMSTSVRVGKEVIMVGFDPDHAATLLSPSAAWHLASSNGGKAIGASFREPNAIFGLALPAQRFGLGTPLAFGPFRLTTANIRSVTDTPAPDESEDEDEIVVTARKKPKGRAVIVIGGDDMRGCSSLSFDKVKKEIRLVC